MSKKIAKRRSNAGINVLAAALVLIAAGIIALYAYTFGGTARTADFETKVKSLKEYVFSGGDIESVINAELGGAGSYTVFISVGYETARADVFHATKPNLGDAWDKAAEKAKAGISGRNREAAYLRADVVNNTTVMPAEDFPDYVKTLSRGEWGYFRYGMAFDEGFKTALLEAEINGNRLIDYKETFKPRLGRIKEYMKEHNRGTLKSIPDEIILFSCRGYFYDGEDFYTLAHEPNNNYGRRSVDNLDKGYMTDIITRGANYLVNLQKSDGAYIYGYFPITDMEIENYNILRHAGTTWSLLQIYRVTGDEALVEPIKKAVGYLAGEAVYKDENTAYIVERKDNEIKIGANGISLLPILDYMEIFGSGEYDDLAKKIGDGILELQDGDGRFYHVLYYGEPGYEDFGKKEQFRTVYYDGEATFALCRLYNRFGDKKYLDGAERAMELFIAEDYTKYRDHWLSYAANEITKFVPDERYYEFGLRNVQTNLKRIRNQGVQTPITAELLLAGFEMYDRLKESGADVGYLKGEFDEKEFIETLIERVDYNINAFAYPELTMYFQNPSNITNGFVTRNDSFRCRIDDVQHYIGGFMLYVQNYEAIWEYNRKFSEG
ncbi:MAG: hypothetical protein LBI38_05320 [Oscillospiraceae bacterium]|jgi:hypothetical protein|nr:hypothetical protein [Oscillospiraceae bacterium]